MSFDLDTRLNALLVSDPSEADMSMMYELVKTLESDAESFRFVSSIILFIERHPAIHFGAPGPLVHFLENFYRKGYEEILSNSFRRRPTPHTALMLNRLINGSTDQEKNLIRGLTE